MRNKGYFKSFQQGHLEQDEGSILYYVIQCKAVVKQLRLIVVPIKFRQVVISYFYGSLLDVHIHEKSTLFSTTERFWWSKVNKEVDPFIRGCEYISNWSTHDIMRHRRFFTQLIIILNLMWYSWTSGNKVTYQIDVYLKIL